MEEANVELKGLKAELEAIYDEFKLVDEEGTDLKSTNEFIADGYFHKVKQTIHQYLYDGDDFELSDNDLITMYEFILLQHNYLAKAKEIIGIKEDNNFPFNELQQSLNIEKESGIQHKYTESMYVKLSKDINFISEQLKLIYSVLNKMIKERNIFNQ